MKDTDKLMLDQAKGQHARVVMDMLGPILLQCEKDVVGKLKATYRNGDTSQLQEGVAVLVALDTIKDFVSQTINKGESARVKLGEVNNAK